MQLSRVPIIASLLLLAATITSPRTTAQQIPSPEQFFGFQMGADRRLARWDKLVEYYDGNHVYAVNPSASNHRVRRIATFVERDVLQSGWLLGEDLITEKAAMVSVGHGDGQVVLIGFRAQHRAQTHGTFKLVFNALMGRSANLGDITTGS